jgi:hypothetical protein
MVHKVPNTRRVISAEPLFAFFQPLRKIPHCYCDSIPPEFANVKANSPATLASESHLQPISLGLSLLNNFLRLFPPLVAQRNKDPKPR